MTMGASTARCASIGMAAADSLFIASTRSGALWGMPVAGVGMRLGGNE